MLSDEGSSVNRVVCDGGCRGYSKLCKCHTCLWEIRPFHQLPNRVFHLQQAKHQPHFSLKCIRKEIMYQNISFVIIRTRGTLKQILVTGSKKIGSQIHFLRLFISKHFLEQCVQVSENTMKFIVHVIEGRDQTCKIRTACHRVTWEVYAKCRSQVPIPDLLFQSLKLRPRDFHLKENIYNIDQMCLIYLRFGSTAS